MLTEKEILSFQQLAKRVMGLELTLAEAENQGSRLIQSIELILENKKKIVAKQFQKDDNKENDE
jgi:hypothetical protein